MSMAVLQRAAHPFRRFPPLVHLGARLTKKASYLAGLRCIIAFFTPLIIGVSLGDASKIFPLALASGMIALGDPQGSRERRTCAMLAEIFGGVLSLCAGELLGKSIVGSVVFACALAYVTGMLCEFGMAGMRTGVFISSMGFIGAASSAAGSLLHPLDILGGGLLPLILGMAFFYRGFWQRKHFATHLRDFRHHYKEHLLLKTPIGRHALRMAIAAGMGVSMGHFVGVTQGTWAGMASIGLLAPSSPVFYQRSLTYMTSVTLATLVGFILITFIHNISVQIVLIAILLFLTATLRGADYATFAFLNALFYIIVVMLVSGVGGADLLKMRLIGSALGAIFTVVICALTLPARERIALLAWMGLPLPVNTHIDDPVMARIRLEQVLTSVYHHQTAGVSEHLLEAFHDISNRYLFGIGDDVAENEQDESDDLISYDEDHLPDLKLHPW